MLDGTVVLLFLGVLRMKNIFKKGLVVLFASLFVTAVFATEAQPTKLATAAPAHKMMKKHHKKCWKNKAGKKVCKKMHHKKMMKKAEAATPAKA
ncbi:hypothetical protein CO044_04745 [Candidatus Peregrinibacteria bacterium CG_4_9_14_0_2_um_filter_38_9]|nr:MAG: hypothetical protein CO044_04745 [Candidatus Peregrinibacteria bacterium CG_4_9_14_0_2_um_filter_38_9]